MSNEKPIDTEKANSVSPNGLSIQERIGPTKGDGIEEILGQSNLRREVYLTVWPSLSVILGSSGAGGIAAHLERAR